jgi:hypothetical protein
MLDLSLRGVYLSPVTHASLCMDLHPESVPAFCGTVDVMSHIELRLSFPHQRGIYVLLLSIWSFEGLWKVKGLLFFRSITWILRISGLHARRNELQVYTGPLQ